MMSTFPNPETVPENTTFPFPIDRIGDPEGASISTPRFSTSTWKTGSRYVPKGPTPLPRPGATSPPGTPENLEGPSFLSARGRCRSASRAWRSIRETSASILATRARSALSSLSFFSFWALISASCSASFFRWDRSVSPTLFSREICFSDNWTWRSIPESALSFSSLSSARRPYLSASEASTRFVQYPSLSPRARTRLLDGVHFGSALPHPPGERRKLPVDPRDEAPLAGEPFLDVVHLVARRPLPLERLGELRRPPLPPFSPLRV